MGHCWARLKSRFSYFTPTKSAPDTPPSFGAPKKRTLGDDDDYTSLHIPGSFPATPPESPTLAPIDPHGETPEGKGIAPMELESMEIGSLGSPSLTTDLGLHLHPRPSKYYPPTPPRSQAAPSPRPQKIPKRAAEPRTFIDDPWEQQTKDFESLDLGRPVSAVQLFSLTRKDIPANRVASVYAAEWEKREKERQARLRDSRRPTRVIPRGPPVRDLSWDWLDKLQRACQSAQGQAVAKSLAGDDLYPKDIVTCIRPLAWLNDEIINAYLPLLVHYLRQSTGNLKPNEKPRFHAFNTFFYSTLRDKGYQGVRRWANRAKIGGEGLLNVDTVFIPVHESSHWTLIVVRPADRTIEYFDSLGSRGARQVKRIKEWLAGELGSKYKEDEWTTLPSVSSQQDNGSDCGVFLLTNAKAVSIGVEPTAFGPGHTQLLRRKIVAELMNGGLHGDFTPLDKATGVLLL
ncbi:hypothetical protein PENANT_c011G11080 [Penicillium antarcticum]|uniref:Ubiquitin-like protease family profile domain-containing protein n=1 Tax=Penicillium antarcticum TaxID=416450 RepID=A0A1V6Q7T9_9EURO|nr:uncharacterized protein N7508_002923 [Penicillium antarcticum]KAJ5312093.1 hypothetical protein N7508_002923 [Penicillium antarcticum]OQD84876.1 hypothetical protein PENANT_c011G11080 [Penicillium antarcticum]